MASCESIIYKNRKEMEKLKEAGRLTANALRVTAKAVKPGISLLELDKIAENYIRKQGGSPSFKGYHGFPSTICTSVNDHVVHGIPSRYILRDGDLITIDCGAKLDGFHGDSCMSIAVGQVNEQIQRLIKDTKLAVATGISYCNIGYRLGDMASAIQTFAEGQGYSIVREYIGHGIGRALHEPPQVMYADIRPQTGFRMEPGMAITVEPILNLGSHHCRVEPDGWTVRTVDGAISAQFEHTVAITKNGPWILSTPDSELKLEDDF
jgi:methionyl aminopeptidase